jgi:hypothetical protein
MAKFSDFDLVKVEKQFNINQVRNLAPLDEWLVFAYDFQDTDSKFLNLLKQEMKDNANHWNEQELSLHFIGPMLSFVNFSDENYRFNAFAARPISALVDGIEMWGMPDGMIASGRREPKIPFFCFQAGGVPQYKKQIDPNGDPIGQVLAAMLVGQELNGHTQPIFGCYILGKEWNFMVLKEKEYAVSQSFDASSNEIMDIFRILQGLKKYVKEATKS